MKPFNELDQSVPAPEFGAGFSLRCTHQDECDLETWCDLKLFQVREQYIGTPVTDVDNWLWISNVLQHAKAKELFEILGFLLKGPDGERANLNLENVRFHRQKISLKVQMCIIACRDGMTIEEIQTKIAEQEASGDVPSPLPSPAEDISPKSSTSESEPG